MLDDALKKIDAWFNHPLETIAGLESSDIEALRAKGIESAEDFWPEMEKNEALVDDCLKGTKDAAAKERVLKAMSQLAKQRAESIISNRFVRHIPDIIVTLVPLGLIIYSLFLVDRLPAKSEIAQQVVVTAPEGLEPFRVIKKSDVEVLASTKSASALTSVELVIGRYATEKITGGAVIDQSKLSSGPRLSDELDGLRVFGVKLQASPILVNLKPPVKVGIVPSPRARDGISEPKIYEVYILALDSKPDGVSAVVATTAADGQKLVSVISSADLIAVGPVR